MMMLEQTRWMMAWQMKAQESISIIVASLLLCVISCILSFFFFVSVSVTFFCFLFLFIFFLSHRHLHHTAYSTMHLVRHSPRHQLFDFAIGCAATSSAFVLSAPHLSASSLPIHFEAGGCRLLDCTCIVLLFFLLLRLLLYE